MICSHLGSHTIPDDRRFPNFPPAARLPDRYGAKFNVQRGERCPTNEDSLIKRLRRTRPSIDSFVPFSPTTRKAAGHKMTLLATPLAFLVFFSGFAVAQISNISSPNCASTWSWVCILSFPSSDLMIFSSSHSIPSTKIRVGSQRPCWGHAMGAVSRLLVCFALPWRALSSFAAFTILPLQQGQSYVGPGGADDSDLCKCSTVGYSLLSACGGCQGGTWFTYDSCCYLLNFRVLCIWI